MSFNLSGGIGIPYTPDQEPNDIRAIGNGVKRVYKETLIPAGMGQAWQNNLQASLRAGSAACSRLLSEGSPYIVIQ